MLSIVGWLRLVSSAVVDARSVLIATGQVFQSLKPMQDLRTPQKVNVSDTS
jgi:archaeosine-15-forming tRNA-guanine transglycosylase